MVDKEKLTIINFFSLMPKKGEVGIEIEIEGVDLPDQTVCSELWRRCDDYSLRGESGEYYLKNPVSRKMVPPALNELNDVFKKTESKLKPSDRCGVHIHVNVQTLTKRQVMNFAILYYILEDILVHYCGNNREGNLFCLRAKDAEYIVKLLKKASEYGPNSSFGELISVQYKYSALNFSSLEKFGSLEFRSLQTPEDILLIKNWVDILLCIKDASLKFKQASEICEIFSSRGSRNILEMIFSNHLNKLMMPDMDLLVFEGVRRIQSVAYAKRTKRLVRKRKITPEDYVSITQFMNSISEG